MSTVQAVLPLRVVAVSGSLQKPSKTTALVEQILTALSRQLPINPHLIQLSELGSGLVGALQRDVLPRAVEEELLRIEEAELLVVASPVYRASFTGLFKHLFDLVGQYSLVGKPVLLAATGGSDRHALAIEHQLRPLFGFFQALTLPIGVYANDSDFTDHRITNPELNQRIELAVARAAPLIRLSAAQTAPALR